MAARALASSPTPISITWYAQGTETATDPDTNACTVAVTHVNGTVILASTAATRTGVGVYTATIPAQSVPADVIIVWTGTFGGLVRTQTDYLKLVGGFFADLADIRALDGIAGNVIAYPTATLIAKRESAETLFEQATGKHWTLKYQRDVLDGDSSTRRADMSAYFSPTITRPSRRLMLSQRLPRTILAVTIDSGDGAGPVAQTDTATYRLYPSGELERGLYATSFPRGFNNIVVEYTYGEDQPPGDLRDAFLTYVRELILKTNSRIPPNATSMQSESMSVQLAQATGWQKPTGIPMVDAVIQRYSIRTSPIA